jgi:hypothetical protein
MTNRTVIKTINGFRVYGAFTSVMDIDTNGTVTYSNMVADCKEYRAMFRAYKNFAA